jgi:hypothetical protein
VWAALAIRLVDLEYTQLELISHVREILSSLQPPRSIAITTTELSQMLSLVTFIDDTNFQRWLLCIEQPWRKVKLWTKKLLMMAVRWLEEQHGEQFAHLSGKPPPPDEEGDASGGQEELQNVEDDGDDLMEEQALNSRKRKRAILSQASQSSGDARSQQSSQSSSSCSSSSSDSSDLSQDAASNPVPASQSLLQASQSSAESDF